jgi:two-component sensor histidine kinase
MDEFAKSFEGRLQSMTAAHSLLSQTRWHGVGLADLVRDQLAPYATEANAKISGPNILLTPVATQAVAMVLHELVTNAAKYGALSGPAGQVSVEWDKTAGADAAATLTLVWREIGGPPVVTPAQAGFGMNLIRDLIPYELSGRVDLAFSPEGICCTIEFPPPQA